jgi:tripartite ATP-independent transporter DctM subunit
MKEAGFDNPFACAVTAASSTVGPIVPPSVPMVIYGVIAEVSIARLFVGGLIPGIIMGIAIMLFIYFIARKRHYPVDPRSNLRETAKRFGQSWLALLTPIIIMGGIMTGVFSPTEAGVIASFYTLVVALFVYREFQLKNIPRLLTRVGKETAIILIITAAATIFGWLLSVLQVPRQVANLLGSTINRPILLLLLINLIYLVVGCFINTIPAIAMTVPVFLPIVQMAGVDPIHFGVVVVLNLCIGMITPPVGSVLFVTARVGQISLTTLVRELLPFYLTLISVLFLISIFPFLTLWLPSLVF